MRQNLLLGVVEKPINMIKSLARFKKTKKERGRKKRGREGEIERKRRQTQILVSGMK